MKKLLEQVGEFHRVYDHPIAKAPRLVDGRLAALRVRLIEEELGELAIAIEQSNIVEIADALGDLAYVVAGAALVYGIPLDRVVDEIHRANMSKLGKDGKPVKRADGKILKGPNYTPPNVAAIINE
jgi:predicted HAD superfamily Cof-like phosphohydrolase